MIEDPPPTSPAPVAPGTGTREPTDAPEEASPVNETFIGPRGHERRGLESLLVRIVATCGIIGIAVGLAAILGTKDVAPWIIGLAVSALSVVLAAILWSSRTL